MKRTLAWLIFIAALTPGTVGAETSKAIVLPVETEVYAPANLPGYALVNSTCLTCHSVEYSKYQPSTSTRNYWKATVIKMQKTFGAPIPDEQIEAMVDYLVRTYGAEKASVVAPGARLTP